MKHTPILLTLVAASASAAVGVGSGLNYNRVEVGYTNNDAFKGLGVSATAELANSGVLVSGSYSDLNGKGDLDGLDGHETGFGLAYKFNVGSGDLAVGLGYRQGQYESDIAVAQGEQKSFGVQYRQAIGSFEVSAGYQRVRTQLGALAVDIFGDIYAVDDSISANVFNVGARYNFTQNFDVSLSYVIQKDEIGGNGLAISAGYSF